MTSSSNNTEIEKILSNNNNIINNSNNNRFQVQQQCQKLKSKRSLPIKEEPKRKGTIVTPESVKSFSMSTQLNNAVATMVHRAEDLIKENPGETALYEATIKDLKTFQTILPQVVEMCRIMEQTRRGFREKQWQVSMAGSSTSQLMTLEKFLQASMS